MKKDKDLIDIIEPRNHFTRKDLCGDCKYKNSFLCDKKFVEGIKETYYKQYDIKIYVYKFNINNKRKIIDLLHNKELFHHRNGGYFALKATNFHCGESCDCECDKTRCWHFNNVPSRRQPRCIKFFMLDIPEYEKPQYAFILGNLEFESIIKPQEQFL